MDIEYRWLDGDAIDQVVPIMRAHGWVPVNPKMGRVRAAFRDGRLIGFVPFSCIPHIDGLYVIPEERGTGIAEHMVKDMVNFLYDIEAPAAYVIADNPVSKRMAEENGMTLVEAPVYVKVA